MGLVMIYREEKITEMFLKKNYWRLNETQAQVWYFMSIKRILQLLDVFPWVIWLNDLIKLFSIEKWDLDNKESSGNWLLFKPFFVWSLSESW